MNDYFKYGITLIVGISIGIISVWIMIPAPKEPIDMFSVRYVAGSLGKISKDPSLASVCIFGDSKIRITAYMNDYSVIYGNGYTIGGAIEDLTHKGITILDTLRNIK